MFGIEMSLFMYAALFVGVLLVVEGAYQLTVDARYGPRAVVNRRMRMIEAGADHSQVLKALRREPRDLEGSARWLSGIALVERRLAQAGLAVPIHRLLLWVVALTLVGLISLRLFTTVPLPLALLASTGLALAVPALYVEWRRRRRVRQFGEQLPAALDLLVRSLRVGHPLSAALNIVAEELPDPIGTEFGIVIDEITYGLDLEDAFQHLNERVEVPDLRYMTVAINIQYSAGGNLAEILAGLARVIRDRFHMSRKIKAVSAEGRLSAVFLSTFPVVLAGALYLINPNYYAQVADDPMFPFLAGLTVVLLIINVIAMRFLVNFKV
jgi:tight adherence protein B